MHCRPTPSSFLATHGWISRGTLHWQHPQLRLHLRADRSWDEDDKARASHSLRESWRLTQWNKLINQRTRHQTGDYRGETYCSDRMILLRKTVASLIGPKRWLMLGAATLPLELMMSFRKKRGEQLAPCPFTDCTCSKASWEHHVVWNCCFRPMDRQERPQSGLLRRYGWEPHALHRSNRATHVERSHRLSWGVQLRYRVCQRQRLRTLGRTPWHFKTDDDDALSSRYDLADIGRREGWPALVPNRFPGFQKHRGFRRGSQARWQMAEGVIFFHVQPWRKLDVWKLKINGLGPRCTFFVAGIELWQAWEGVER